MLNAVKLSCSVSLSAFQAWAIHLGYMLVVSDFAGTCELAESGDTFVQSSSLASEVLRISSEACPKFRLHGTPVRWSVRNSTRVYLHRGNVAGQLT